MKHINMLYSNDGAFGFIEGDVLKAERKATFTDRLVLKGLAEDGTEVQETCYVSKLKKLPEAGEHIFLLSKEFHVRWYYLDPASPIIESIRKDNDERKRDA